MELLFIPTAGDGRVATMTDIAGASTKVAVTGAKGVGSKSISLGQALGGFECCEVGVRVSGSDGARKPTMCGNQRCAETKCQILKSRAAVRLQQTWPVP